jgi:hypothetical protein
MTGRGGRPTPNPGRTRRIGRVCRVALLALALLAVAPGRSEAFVGALVKGIVAGGEAVAREVPALIADAAEGVARVAGHIQDVVAAAVEWLARTIGQFFVDEASDAIAGVSRTADLPGWNVSFHTDPGTALADVTPDLEALGIRPGSDAAAEVTRACRQETLRLGIKERLRAAARLDLAPDDTDLAAAVRGRIVQKAVDDAIARVAASLPAVARIAGHVAISVDAQSGTLKVKIGTPCGWGIEAESDFTIVPAAADAAPA